MNLRENIILAVEGLQHNKMRALLTMLGIIIGIASVITIASVGSAVSRSFTVSLNKIGGKTIAAYVSQRDVDGNATMSGSDLITEDMVTQFRGRFANEIKSIGISSTVGTGTLDDLQKTQVKISGANGDNLAIQNQNLTAGRNLTSDDIVNERRVTVIPEALSQSYFGRDDAVGETLTLNYKDSVYRLKVVGVYTKDTSSMNMNSGGSNNPEIYLPVSLANILSGTTTQGYSSMTIIAYSEVDSDALSKSISSWFDNHYYSNNTDFTVKTENMDKFTGEITSMLGTLSLAIGLIAGISLLVGGIGVMNIMLVSVTERTREIGIRKALGASNSDIRVQFIVESIIICIIGGAIGVVFGGIFGAIAGIFIKMAVYPTLPSIIIAVAFSMAIGVFFGYYPANRAAKMNPIDALRYE